MQQTEIKFFWPLTEQTELDLDYGWPTHLHHKARGLGSIYEFTTGAISTTAINPQLTITPNNPVGTLSIGGVNIGLEKKPTWLQKQLHKLLGFNWKDK